MFIGTLSRQGVKKKKRPAVELNRFPLKEIFNLSNRFRPTYRSPQGIDVPTVARWLGHKDGGALLRTYSHLLQEHSTAMAAKLML
jgi:hypothetical protein